MKRMFIKLLPVMAAVLLATSCSKDDGNEAAIENPIDTPQQTEPVATAVKTITISGKVGKATLSKVTVADSKLQFEGGEKFTFGEEGVSDVYGDITIDDADGKFTATLNFTDEDNLISNDGFTAELGNKPQGLSEAYDDLETAVKNAYYVIPFKVAKDDGDGTYKLTEGTLSKAAPTPPYDVKVYVQASFIKAQGTRTIKLNGTDVNVEADKYYVVPAGAQMGSNEANKTTAGNVYTVKKLGISYAKTYVGKNVGDGAFTNPITHIGDGTVSYASDKADVAEIGTDGTVTIKGVGKTTITATLSGYSDDCPEDTRTATYTLVVAPENCIPGLFSVADGKQVFFSKGNLQATTSDKGTTWTWGFATNQYDYIGNSVANTEIDGAGIVSENGTVDLFGWVGGSSETLTGGVAQYGISNSTTESDYGNTASEDLKSDWCQVAGIGEGWNTLTGGNNENAEWYYLFNTRDNYDKLYGWGSIKVGDKTINGLILLPDDWILPADCNFTSGMSANNSYKADEGESWFKMEAAGAVFLPAAGFRFGTTVKSDGSYGTYWSRTAIGKTNAYNVCFESGELHSASYYRYYGRSVRLVRGIPYKSGEGQGGYEED